MANTPHITGEENFEQHLGAIDEALAKARLELGAMTESASAANGATDASAPDYSLHEVAGVGRYAVVRKTGWRPLLNVIHTPEANIDFSATLYPAFDGIIGEQFPSPYLLDPMNDKFNSYKHLRDNIAAVRNFLMETYYVDTPAGMTPEKAKQSLSEIADYVGKGLNNNYLFLGVIPNHHLGKPFISINEACATGGAGAQYLYEKILEMHRQSSWMRPFAAVIALFGGHTPPDWMPPPAHETEFTTLFSDEITHAQAGAAHDAVNKQTASVAELEAARQRLIDKHQLSTVATDLNMMGDQLVYNASNMQNVAQLSEPVRRDAIEIAKDILKKLRFSLGDITIKNGLNLPPSDDASALGAIKGVSLIYERMLGWARGIDPHIMQHPSVLAATQAIGQMGYLAKMEALRMAKLCGNEKLAGEITTQMASVPASYRTASDAKFAGLIDKIESGINVLMTRVQTINGPNAMIGHSASKEVGQSINQAPTAGLGQQATSSGHTTNNDAAKRNAELVAAENAFQQTQAARIQQQNARARMTDGNAAVTTSAPRRGTPRQTTTTTTSKPSFTSTSTTAPNFTGTTSTQQANALRQAQLQREKEEHDAQERQRIEAQRIQQLQAQQKAAAKAAAMKIDPSMLKGFQSATNTKGMGPVVTAKKPIVPVAEKPVPTNGTTVKSPTDKDPFTPPTGRGGRGI